MEFVLKNPHDYSRENKMISTLNAAQTTLPTSLPVPCNVLVVDDDPANLLLTTRVLQGYGCKVFVADSPKKAIEFFELYGELIDILVSDVSMPEMNGYDLAELLRRRNPHLAVLFMSASPEWVAAKRRVSVIGKPFTFSGLINSVAAVLHSYPITSTPVFFLSSIEKGERNAHHRSA